MLKRILSLLISLLFVLAAFSAVPVSAAETDPVIEVALITDHLVEVRFNQNVSNIDSKSDFAIFVNGTQLSSSRYSFWNYMDMIYGSYATNHEYIATLYMNTAQTEANAAAMQVQITDSSAVADDGTAIDTTKKYQVKYDPYYQKKLMTNAGVLVKAPASVLDSTVIAAGRQVDIMLSYNSEIAASLANMGASLAIIPATKNPYTIPEHRQGAYEGGYYAEGYGGTVYNQCTSSITEQNIHRWLNSKLYPDTTSYTNENILTHEFGHGVKLCGIDRMTDKTLSNLIKTTYTKVRAEGKWDNTYAGSNIDEYFATLTNIWFGTQSEVRTTNGTWGPINTRAELKVYDPDSFALFEQIYPKTQMPAPWNLTHNSYDYSEGVTDPDTLDSSTVPYVTDIWKYSEEGSVDKTALQTALTQANGFSSSDYTSDSFAALTSAKNSAQSVYDNAGATQAQVDAAVSALNTAIDGLVAIGAEVVLDKSKLETATRTSWAEYLENYNNWTSEGKNRWSTTYDTGYALLWGTRKDEAVTQAYINQATQDLYDAIDYANYTMLGSGDFNSLNALITKAEGYNKSSYTAESYSALQTAITSAKAVSANANSSHSDTDKAIDSLDKAIKALVEYVCVHTDTEWVTTKAATCTAQGTETKICKNCSETLGTRATSALGHSFTKYTDNGDGTETAVCDHGCGISSTKDITASSSDKQKLQQLITAATAISGEGYTEESFSALQTALENARKTAAFSFPTQLAVNTAYNTLEAAINALEEKKSDALAISVASDKESYVVNEEITLIVVTSKEVKNIGITNHGSGAFLGKKKQTYVDDGNITIWTVTIALGTKGSRTLDIWVNDGNGFDKTDLTVSFKITNQKTESSEQIKINSIDPTTISGEKGAKMMLTVITTKSVTKLGIFNENGSGISSSKTYEDTASERIWTVSFAVGSKGIRSLYVLAGDDNGYAAETNTPFKAYIGVPVPSEEVKEVKIISASVPKLNYAANETIVITAVTTTSATKIGVFNESNGGISASKSYVDEGENRIWTISMNVSTKGSRTFTIRAGSSSGFVQDGCTVSVRMG